MEHMNFDGTDITNFLCQTLFLLLWHFLMFDINSFCYSPYIWFVSFSFHFPDGPFLGDQCCEAGQCIGHADQRRGVLWTGQVLLLYVAHLDVWGVNRENICPTLKTHLFYTKLNFYQEFNCSINLCITNISTLNYHLPGIYAELNDTKCIGIFKLSI